VFLLGASIAFAGNLVYVCFASGEEQEWNRGETKKEAELNEER
jgi:hypothetical protein